MVPDNGKGLIDIPSNHSVDETVTKLEGILQAKGITLFALVDHSGEAAKVGMKMRPTKLLIFGNPRAGTPVMLAAPSSAIDLPLKILVWEDDQGKVWITYNSPSYLQERHNLRSQLLPNIAVIETLAKIAAQQWAKLHFEWLHDGNEKVETNSDYSTDNQNISALAPTQTEQPFRTTQLVVLALFVVLAIAAAIRFRIEPIRAI
jgi:uncharacterized protein (DUF302 family)